MASSPSPDTIRTKQFRRPRLFSVDVFIKVFSLIFSIAVVWAVYARWVWPEVERVTLTAQVMARSTGGYVPPRSIAVIVKDPEQQAEVTLWVWAMILLTLKMVRLSQENRMLDHEYIRLEPGERILPDDSLGYYQDLKATLETRRSWRDRILPAVIMAALHRFHATRSIMDAAQAIKERSEVAGNEFEADLALIRYTAWAIPAIGFIGTVRGIGEALGQAQKAIAGDISGVVDALGLAFNSTLVALLLSMVLMFVLHLMQGLQDKLVLNLQNYCEDKIVGQMKVPSHEAAAPAFQG
jgi:biopolymer transport protein ExbB/TolQ